MNISELKFKNIPKDFILLCLDRLTRFKNPEINYKRVFFDIITKFVIEPKFSKKELENLTSFEIVQIIERVWNSSVKTLTEVKDDFEINNILLNELNGLFFVDDDYTKNLLNAKINISSLLKFVDDDFPFNLVRLREIDKLKEKTVENILKIRRDNE